MTLVGKNTGGGILALVIIASIGNVISQSSVIGVEPALIAFFASIFGDVVAGPLLEHLMSGELEEISEVDIETLIIAIESKLEQRTNSDDQVQHSLLEILRRQDVLSGALSVALQYHENSTVERILRAVAGDDRINPAYIIERFSQSNKKDFDNLNTEIQYLTDLITDLRYEGNVWDSYVTLPVIANEVTSRPFESTFSKQKRLQTFSKIIFEETTEKVPHRDRKKVRLPEGIADAVRDHPRFVLLGDPGSGKSTTIQHLALETALKRLNDPQSSPLPFYQRLTDWDVGRQTFIDFIQTRWPLTSDPSGLLARGEMRIYLDGLNELGRDGEAKAKELREWLKKERSAQYVIVTCRDSAYGDYLDLDLPLVFIEKMDDATITAFVNTYVGEQAEALLSKLLNDNGSENRQLARLAENPFLLTLLIRIHQDNPEHELPLNNGALFHSVVQNLWDRERRRNTPGWISYELMASSFATLAFAMILEDQPTEVSLRYVAKHFSDNLLPSVGSNANLLQIRNNQVRFFHQLMQEYFAAIALTKRNFIHLIKKPHFSKYTGQRVASKWDEVISALCGISGNADSIIKDLVSVDVWLAAKCLLDGAVTSTKTYDAVLSALRGKLSNQSAVIQNASAQLIGELRDPQSFFELTANISNLSPRVRRSAIQAMLLIDPKRAGNYLLNRLNEDKAVGSEIIQSLFEIGTADAQEILDVLKAERNLENTTAISDDKQVSTNITGISFEVFLKQAQDWLPEQRIPSSWSLLLLKLLNERQHLSINDFQIVMKQTYVWLSKQNNDRAWPIIWQKLAEQHQQFPPQIPLGAFLNQGHEWLLQKRKHPFWPSVWQEILEQSQWLPAEISFGTLLNQGYAWLAEKRKHPIWGNIWQKLIEERGNLPASIPFQELLMQGYGWLLEQQVQLTWPYVWQKLLVEHKNLPSDISYEALLIQAFAWLSEQPNHPGWTLVWQKLVAERKDLPPDISYGALLIQAFAWLSEQPSHHSWPTIWQKLVAERKALLPDISYGALLIQAFAWLSEQHNHSKWPTIWQKLVSERKDLPPDISYGALLIPAFAWLSEQPNHPIWPMIWQKLLTERDYLAADDFVTLLKRGYDHLPSRENGILSPIIWQKLMGEKNYLTIDEFEELLRWGFNWLDGRENHSAWSHNWEILANEHAHLPIDDFVTLLRWGYAWQMERETHDSWVYVWEKLVREYEYLPSEISYQALLGQGYTWLIGREMRSRWPFVWQKLVAERAQLPPGLSIEILLRQGQAWLLGREVQEEWLNVWKILLNNLYDNNQVYSCLQIGLECVVRNVTNSSFPQIWLIINKFMVLLSRREQASAVEIGIVWLERLINQEKFEWSSIWLTIAHNDKFTEYIKDKKAFSRLGLKWLENNPTHPDYEAVRDFSVKY